MWRTHREEFLVEPVAGLGWTPGSGLVSLTKRVTGEATTRRAPERQYNHLQEEEHAINPLTTSKQKYCL